MGTKALIIDGKNQLYRANYSNSGLQYKGESVAALYGFIQILHSVIQKIKPDYVIVCWDGKKHPRRMQLIPEYKQRLKPRLDFDSENFYKQEGNVRKALSYLGIPQISDTEMEADDYIYHQTRILKKKYDRVYIMSADKDFNQLISKKVVVWNDKDNKLLHHKNLLKEKGYTAEQCVSFLALCGDNSDNITGYRGIGEVTALRILKEHGSVENYIKYIDQEKKGMHGKVIGSELKKLWVRNSEMIDLKLFYLKNLKGKLQTKVHKPEPKIDKFFKLCKKYGFKRYQDINFVNQIIKR